MGRAEDVGRVAVFLAGGDSDYLTGEIIDVNGGP
ncbi:MAG: SDR family oxidoreductase, partial [Proteobacteria bacterium]|nr:SDR family oxidoreductase [Pseudomonadota bacterium]